MSNYIITPAGGFYDSDELYHYGVPGMKWGKRKASYYEVKSRSHLSAINDSKTRLGKSYHNYRAYRNEVKAGNRKIRENASSGSLLNKLDDRYGHGSNARVQNAKSKYYNRKSQYTKTRLGTTKAKSNAYNEKTAADANTRLHNSKSLREYGSNYANAFVNRSIKSWSGRTTTTGKNLVDKMLTGGIVGTVADIDYYARGSRKKKD